MAGRVHARRVHLPRVLFVAVFVVGLGLVQCASNTRFPSPMHQRLAPDQAVLSFDMDGDLQPDYWQYRNAAGRTAAIAFAARAGEEATERISLDALRADDCPHLVIALDGVPFEVVQRLYAEGHFRLFHRPTRLICCYPAMTDLALADMFHELPCRGFQALYYDRHAEKLSDSSQVYLGAKNSPWVKHMDYRCSFWWDALVYLNPQMVFNHELSGIRKTFAQVSDGDAYAYSVGTAGLGTRGGEPAIVEYLTTIDNLCEQIVHQRRGRVKITLTADHGHNLVPNERVEFAKALKAGGYRVAKSLREPRNVVVIPYGLVTYAEFYTADAAGVARCLSTHDAVEFACYREDDVITVLNADGLARIRPADGGYVYNNAEGDPLGLRPTLKTLRLAGMISETRVIDDHALFEATIEHAYPDALDRLWRAFFAEVENPPDVIVNLRDGTCHGSQFFANMIGQADSTHGNLNQRNSTTFVLTMLGELPPALRTRELMGALAALRDAGEASAGKVR